MAVMLPESSPLVGNLEKWFSDSLSDRHLRIVGFGELKQEKGAYFMHLGE